MNEFDTLRLIGVILAVISIFIPITISWMEKKKSLNKSKYFVELLETRKRLIDLSTQKIDQSFLVGYNNSKLPETEKDQIFINIKELNLEITDLSSSKTQSKYFYYFITVEVILFMTFIVFLPVNYHLGFMEGLIKNTFSHIIILMICISLSVYFAMRLTKYIIRKYYLKINTNILMLVLFNIIIPIIMYITISMFNLIDPYTRLF